MFSYAEEDLLPRALESIAQQDVFESQVLEVLVMSCGHTEEIERIVLAHAGGHGKIHLYPSRGRRSKVGAINECMRVCRGDILVVCNADTCLAPDAIRRLLAPFQDPAVGMVGGRAVPLDDSARLIGRLTHWLWRLHHYVCLERPKMGELVAWRLDRLRRLDSDTCVDEACAEAWIRGAGGSLAYQPEAVVYNYGPGSFRQFVTQRRRIHCGHLQLRSRHGYTVSTLSLWRIARALFRSGCLRYPGILLCLVCFEGVARALGTWDRLRSRDHSAWKMIERPRLGRYE